jgi:hypothetical protein
MGIFKERIYKVLYEKNSVQRYLARRLLFPLLEPLGFHIVADHFYEPIPNARELEKSYQDTKLRSLPHVAVDFHESEANHTKRLSQYGHEFRREVARFGYTGRNRNFPIVDAISLYCFLREKKPSRVVEVGQGSSTLVMLSALFKNGIEGANKVELVSVDPYNRLLSTFGNLEWADLKIIQRSVQSINSLEFVDLLKDRALLFVDSSHVFKAGSDVEYLIKEIYPQVPRDTYIHVHDIYTPYPWPLKYYLETRYFWDEQDHLESFLNFNDSFRVELPLFWLLKDSEKVNKQFDLLQIERYSLNGASFYIQRTR